MRLSAHKSPKSTATAAAQPTPRSARTPPQSSYSRTGMTRILRYRGEFHGARSLLTAKRRRISPVTVRLSPDLSVLDLPWPPSAARAMRCIAKVEKVYPTSALPRDAFLGSPGTLVEYSLLLEGSPLLSRRAFSHRARSTRYPSRRMHLARIITSEPAAMPDAAITPKIGEIGTAITRKGAQAHAAVASSTDLFARVESHLATSSDGVGSFHSRADSSPTLPAGTVLASMPLIVDFTSVNRHRILATFQILG